MLNKGKVFKKCKVQITQEFAFKANTNESSEEKEWQDIKKKNSNATAFWVFFPSWGAAFWQLTNKSYSQIRVYGPDIRENV